MTAEVFDDVVIGGGQAGPSLAVRLAGAGRRVAIVERRHLGGTCINTGCRPTKALIASAKVAAMARRAADYGIAAGPVSADMPAVMARVAGIVAEGRQGQADWLAATEGLTVIAGHARLDRRARGRGRRPPAGGRAHLPQRRRPRRGARTCPASARCRR